MTEREKIIKIIAPYVSAWGEDERIADALIAAGIGDRSKHRLFISEDGTVCKQLYSCEEVEQIAKERDEYKPRAEVAERALRKAVSVLDAEYRAFGVNRENKTEQRIKNFIEQAEKELAEENNND